MRKGLFITFEGNDGSGKTTQIRLLADYLRNKGIEVVLTREPGGTPIGEKIRSVLLDKANKEMHPVTEMLLYAASRAQLVNTLIRPAIEEGKAVICDRFVDSSYAYQAMGRGLGLKTVKNVNSYAIGDCMPDITFFMDIDADAAMKRRNSSGEEADRLESEKIEFHRNVYEGYKNLLSLYPERIKAIDVLKSPEQVFESIKTHIDELLKKLQG